MNASLDHPTVRRVADALRAAGATGVPIALPNAATTAAAAATQLGCDVGAIANSLVFDSGHRPLLVMTSGAHRVQTTQLAAVLGLPPLTRADVDFVRRHTGMAIGGVAPLGHPKPIRTIVDIDLARYPVVWAAAGHPQTVFPTTYDELLRMTGAAEVD